MCLLGCFLRVRSILLEISLCHRPPIQYKNIPGQQCSKSYTINIRGPRILAKHQRQLVICNHLHPHNQTHLLSKLLLAQNIGHGNHFSLARQQIGLTNEIKSLTPPMSSPVIALLLDSRGQSLSYL